MRVEGVRFSEGHGVAGLRTLDRRPDTSRYPSTDTVVAEVVHTSQKQVHLRRWQELCEDSAEGQSSADSGPDRAFPAVKYGAIRLSNIVSADPIAMCMSRYL